MQPILTRYLLERGEQTMKEGEKEGENWTRRHKVRRKKTEILLYMSMCIFILSLNS